MQEIPFSHTIGAGRLTKRVMRALGKDLPVPTAVGLERNGDVLIKPLLSALLPQHGRGGTCLRGLQVRAGEGHVPRQMVPPRAGETGQGCSMASHATPMKP